MVTFTYTIKDEYFRARATDVRELTEQGVPLGNVQQGIMIETPAVFFPFVKLYARPLCSEIIYI